MRMKTFLLVFGCVVITSYVFVMISSTREQNDSMKTIVTQAHQHIKEFHENLVSSKKSLEIDSKYLTLLGYPSASSSSAPPSLQPNARQTYSNHSKANFTIVSYVVSGQTASAISLIQNIATKLPNDTLLLYDVGLNDDDARSLNAYCNNTKCSVIVYDLSPFPAYVSDERMHAFRPLLIKDALNHSKSILFIENNVRMRSLTLDHRADVFRHLNGSGVLGWTTRLAVSSRTHPKMFDYFQTDAENFMFLPMVSLDAVVFTDSELVNEQILLPWIKCTLTSECIHPIGAQSGGCRFNKKPLYRYSGCHGYDVSAFNIVLGLTWNFDETKYSICGDSKLYYVETLEQANKILENKRKNISDATEHQFTSDD